MNWLIFALVAAFIAASPQASAALEVGQAAPPFEAESTMGSVKLSDYLGKKNVLLAFYFKDFTGG